ALYLHAQGEIVHARTVLFKSISDAELLDDHGLLRIIRGLLSTRFRLFCGRLRDYPRQPAGRDREHKQKGGGPDPRREFHDLLFEFFTSSFGIPRSSLG